MANPQMFVEVVTSGAQASVTVVGHGDDVGDAFGDDEDFVIVLNADAYTANAGIDDVLVGTPVTPILAANSAILSNTTEDGDILFAVRDGDHSKGLLKLDGANGNVLIHGGNLGIGTTSPSGTNADGVLLEISSSSEEPGLIIDASGGTSKIPIIEMHADRASASYSAQILFFNSGATPIVEIAALRGSTDTKGDILLKTSGTTRLAIDEDGEIDLQSNTAGLVNVGLAGSDWDSTSLRNAGDYFGINGKGTVIGHTAFVTLAGGETPKLQVLGTGGEDSTLGIGRWSNDAYGPALTFNKSHNGTIGSNTIVVNGDILGMIRWGVDDSGDFNSVSADVRVEVDDGSPVANDVGAAIIWRQMSGDGGALLETMRMTPAGSMLINDSANAQMTTGLTINQGAADDEAFALKSSDVAHGITGMAETDSYTTFQKIDAAWGGIKIVGLTESNKGVALLGGVTSGNTTHAAAGFGAVAVYAYTKDGTGLTVMGADENLFSVHNAGNAAFIVDEDGDLFAEGGTTTDAVTVYDAFDDAQLVRALDIARNSKGLIRDEWDNFLKYGEDKLVELDILGAKLEDGGLINVTGLQRLHNGAIWQGYVRQQEMQEKIDTLENRLLAIEGAK
jgi:hypothetical protein